jgi:FkbM family methyltransferase
MSWAHGIRLAAVARLPKSWQPVAMFHYYRARSLLEPELPLICRALHPGACAVDAGANEGVYTHAFARTGARVEAFEPHPSCLEVLRSYARAHAGVNVHGEALGAAEERATLHVPLRGGRLVSSRASLNGSAPGAAQFPVRVRTLDSFAFPRVDVIKIDVEGRELDVVRGARETIRAHRPVLLVEVEQRHIGVPINHVFAEVVELGYAGRFIHPELGIRPLDEFTAESHQPATNADTAGAFYINNFIFTPRESAQKAALFE